MTITKTYKLTTDKYVCQECETQEEDKAEDPIDHQARTKHEMIYSSTKVYDIKVT